MKKVMVFFLLLLVACMGFAEPPYVETLNVTLTIAEIPVGVAFTEKPYTDPADQLSPLTSVDLGKIEESGTNGKSFWASARTNSADPLQVKIYGTALTRKVSDASYSEEEKISLVLSIQTPPEEAKNSSGQEGTATFDEVYKSGYTWREGEFGLTLIEGAPANNAAGVAGTGTRALTWNLKVSATVESGNTPTAGSYESYIWIVVGSGSTGT